MFIVIGTLGVCAAITLNSLHRIKVMDNELDRIIDDCYKKRVDLIQSFNPIDEGGWELLDQMVEDIKYPDIQASFDNVKWYKFWEDPRKLVEYEL